MTEAYPLRWPDGWPRTPGGERKRGDYRFKRQSDSGSKPWTFAAARDALLGEASRHTKGAVVLSTNFDLNRAGLPRGDRRRPEDQGVALYFTRKGKPYVIACDRFGDVEGNLRSVTLALEAMRTLERHGGGVMLERAFEGFLALPAPPKWFDVLDLPPTASREAIESAWKAKVRELRPDMPGRGHELEEMRRFNVARDEGLRQVRGGGLVRA